MGFKLKNVMQIVFQLIRKCCHNLNKHVLRINDSSITILFTSLEQLVTCGSFPDAEGLILRSLTLAQCIN